MIFLNGERSELAAGETLAAALERLGVAPDQRGVAVAVDGEVVPRGRWSATELASGQRIEVLQAVQGG